MCDGRFILHVDHSKQHCCGAARMSYMNGGVCAAGRYQQKLQNSLMYLASIADAQPQAAATTVPPPLVQR